MADQKDSAATETEDATSTPGATPVVIAPVSLPSSEAPATQATSDDREGTLSPAPEPGVAVQTRKGPVCPTCKEPLVVYVGTALHKLGTAFCSRCGIRHHLKG